MPVGANLDTGSPSAGPASEDVANRRDIFLAQDSNTTPPFASQPVAGRVVTELESTLIATSKHNEISIIFVRIVPYLTP